MIERALVDLFEGWQCEWTVEVKMLVTVDPWYLSISHHFEVLEESQTEPTVPSCHRYNNRATQMLAFLGEIHFITQDIQIPILSGIISV